MAGVRLPFDVGHSPAAQEHRAAGRPYAWIRDRIRDLATVLVVSVIAFGVFLTAMGLLGLLISISVAHAQTANTQNPAGQNPAGQGSDARIGGVTVTAPDCRNPQNPAPACAAQRLNQAAQAAEAKGQAAAATASAITVPDAQSPAATIGLGTPAAAAQQPGTPFGKPPGYTPPPLPSVANAGAGPFARSPR